LLLITHKHKTVWIAIGTKFPYHNPCGIDTFSYYLLQT
jgi:hypothetical protein